MNQIHLIAFFLLIFVGALMLMMSSRQEKTRQSLRKYLHSQKSADDKESTSLLAWLDSVIPAGLVHNEADINQKMIDAGIYSFQYSHLYLPLKIGTLLLGSGFIFFLLYNELAFSLTTVVMMIAGWVILILILPDAILNSRVKVYRSVISQQLPYLIDLLAVCVQTGMTIESSLSYLAKEMYGFDARLAKLVGRTNERASLVGLDKALEELYQHIPTSEMRSFVMTLKQSLQYGSSIYETLTTLSADIRQVSMLTVEEKIGKLSAKMSVPLILFIMLPIVILIAAPGVMRMLSGVY